MPKPLPPRPIKTIGLIYSDDPESWCLYRQQIEQQFADRFGTTFRPRLIANAAQASALEHAMHTEDWREVERLAILAAKQAIAGGAECLVLCNGSLHVVAAAIANAAKLPLIHLVDGALNSVSLGRHKRVGILGTRFRAEHALWQDRFREQGIAAIPPTSDGIKRVTEIIREKLVHGLGDDAERGELFRIAADFRRQGVSMVVLVAPELQLFISHDNAPFPITNAMSLQVANAITWATGRTLTPFFPSPPCEASV